MELIELRLIQKYSSHYIYDTSLKNVKNKRIQYTNGVYYDKFDV